MDILLPPLLLGGGVVAACGLVSLSALLDRRRAEGRIRVAERDLEARGRYLGLVAQEMQTHGLALLGHATAASGAASGLELRARALLGLAADVSDLLASSAGPRSIKEEEIPLGPVLDEVIGHITQSLTPGRRAWHVAPELRAVSLRVDRRAMVGALRQVLARVIRQTGDGDSVQMRLVRADTSIAIVIEDDGHGHASEDLNGLNVSHGTRGVGLGLVVARDLLRAHGGELTVEAVPGIGARAWLTLPRERAVAPPPSAPPKGEEQ